MAVLRFLVTGANGFTGHRFATSDRACGHKAIVLWANLNYWTELMQEVAQATPAAFVIPNHVANFARHAEAVKLSNPDLVCEFNDVRFVCESFLHLSEKAKPCEVVNVCASKPGTFTSAFALLSPDHGPPVASQNASRFCVEQQDSSFIR